MEEVEPDKVIVELDRQSYQAIVAQIWPKYLFMDAEVFAQGKENLMLPFQFTKNKVILVARSE